MPPAEDGHVRLWAGFRFTAQEYLSFWCLLCTANVPVGDFNAVSRLSDPHEAPRGSILVTTKLQLVVYRAISNRRIFLSIPLHTYVITA